MKMTVTGVSRTQGTSQKTQRPYDMAFCYVLSPVQIQASENRQSSGFGFEVAELHLAPDSISKFGRCAFPCELDLTTDNVMRFGKLETVVTGFNPA